MELNLKKKKKSKEKYILFSFSIKMRKCTWVEFLRNPFLQVLSGFDKPLYSWLKVVFSKLCNDWLDSHCTKESPLWFVERNPSEKDLQFKRLLWRGVWKKPKKKQNDMLSYEKKNLTIVFQFHFCWYLVFLNLRTQIISVEEVPVVVFYSFFLYWECRKISSDWKQEQKMAE